MDDLVEAERISQQMLASAKADEWDQIIPLASERLALLQTYFSNPVSTEYAGEVEMFLIRLESCDRQLAVLCDSRREQLADQLQELNKFKKGTAAYQANR